MISTTFLRRTLVLTLQTVVSTLIQLVEFKWLEGARKQTFWKVGHKRMKCLIFNCRCLKRQTRDTQNIFRRDEAGLYSEYRDPRTDESLSPSKRNKNVWSPVADMSLFNSIQYNWLLPLGGVFACFLGGFWEDMPPIRQCTLLHL